MRYKDILSSFLLPNQFFPRFEDVIEFRNVLAVKHIIHSSQYYYIMRPKTLLYRPLC